ncbi:MAG TPA: Fic family protein [Erysipelotrichaceae bacterium]|nr:Fic family protein [Erysipelotrichaceae bacterium]
MRKFNYSDLKNKTWDSTIINRIGKIHEAKGRQELYLSQKPEELNKLVELAKIQSTEASNAIEGIRTTDTRLKKIINEKTTPKNRSEKEIVGYRDALNTIHESFEYIPITPNYILQLHRILCGQNDEISYGGKFKDVQNYINATNAEGDSYTLFTPVSPFETPTAIENLCNEFNKAIDSHEVNPLILIPIFIHDFLCVHPFNDGNGRMSRLLTTLLLYRSGYYVGKYISLELKISKLKDLYYDSLYASQIGWHEGKDDPTPFVSYLLSIIEMAYDDFENRVEIVSKKLSAYEAVKNALDVKIGKVTKSDILELCPLLSASSIEKVLAKMVKEGKLEKNGSGKNTFYIIKL